MMDNELLAYLKLAKDIVRKAEGQRSVTVEYQSPFRTSPDPEWSRAFSVDMPGYARRGAAVPILPTAGGRGAASRATISWP